MYKRQVQPSLENERRFATVQRLSEMNLGLYRTFLQPFIKASINDQAVEWIKKLTPADLPAEIFSARNPMMQLVAQLAEQVRQSRQPASADNPLLTWQTQLSAGIVKALDGYRDLHDASLEQLFLATYSSPLLQAMVGLPASDESPRQRPANEPERAAFVEKLSLFHI